MFEAVGDVVPGKSGTEVNGDEDFTADVDEVKATAD